MSQRMKIYKWTRFDGTTGGRRVFQDVLVGGANYTRISVSLPRTWWRPGVVVRAPSRLYFRKLCSGGLLHAFRSEADAHANTLPCAIPLDHNVLWEGDGYICRNDVFKVGCRAMVLHKIIQGALHA